jgi:hypothetical protein
MPGQPNRDNNPTLEEAIKAVIERRLVDVHTTLPGKVVDYDPATQKATVQIQLKRKYVDGTTKEIPPIPAVPVVFPRGKGGTIHIHWKLEAGDDVVLHFSERSLDNWKTAGGMSDPADTRKFHLSDAFCTPGGAAFPDAFAPKDPEAFEIQNADTQILLYDDGKLKLNGGNDDELVKVLYDLVNLIKSATTTTIFGPQPLVPPTDPTWDLIKLRIQAFKKD